MKHAINALVDCVFKALFGRKGNEDVLIDFLNCVLKPQNPIVGVQVLNPYNEKEYLGDKLSIVDIKAEDENKNQFDIELQLGVAGHLKNRMLFY